MSQPKFEDCIEIIDQEIYKHRRKWQLSSIAWMDFEDIAQIIRIHIYNKWSMYDPKQSLLPWISVIISNQLRNLVRNVYSSHAKPCLQCAAAESENGCLLYYNQGVSCPIYKRWFENKKNAHDISIPLSIENHLHEVNDINGHFLNFDIASERLHNHMRTKLKKREWIVYDLLYIQHKTEDDIAYKLGYKTTEKGRTAGYNTIRIIRKNIITKVKQALNEGVINDS